MDRGVPTEEIFGGGCGTRHARFFYLVGTAKGKIQQCEKKWLDLPWQKVRESVDVKLFEQDGELYVLAKSAGRKSQRDRHAPQAPDSLLRKLRAMRRSLPSRDQLLMRLGAANRKRADRFHSCFLQLPGETSRSRGRPSSFVWIRKKLQERNGRTGNYLLRSNLTAGDPSLLWARYGAVDQIEAVFKSLKSELSIRPIRITGAFAPTRTF